MVAKYQSYVNKIEQIRPVFFDKNIQKWDGTLKVMTYRG